MTANALARLRPETALEAAGYIRVSLERQAEGHSPEVQREAIKRLAAEQGYALTMIQEDHERGSKVTRAGYQAIIEAVRQGTVHAVIVFMFDRWGRDGAEWLTRAREFERLNVPIISVQEGRDEGSLMRFIRAGMAEEYSRQLARRVRPARERAARQGIHMGATPLGYRRIYPAYEGSGRRPPAELVIDEATAWIVRDLFARYASGGWSLRSLAIWLNADARVAPKVRGRGWAIGPLHHILRNPVYCGRVRYNAHQRALYESAPPGSTFVVEGRHDPLVSTDMWDTVQHRLTQAGRRKNFNSRRPTVTLATGLLACSECGRTLIVARPGGTRKGHGQYKCLARIQGQADCTAPSYRIDVAHQALLAEVRRLRGHPWTPQAEQRVVGGESNKDADLVAATRRALEQEQERMRRHARRMSELEYDPTPEEIAAFRDVGAELSGRIRALEAQLADSARRVVALPDLRALHEQLTHTELASVVAALIEQGDEVGLRDLVLTLVASARLIERRPTHRSLWVRLAVTWTPDVQTLLDAGLLWLDDPAPAPVYPSPEEILQARRDRYNASRRERRRENGRIQQ